MTHFPDFFLKQKQFFRKTKQHCGKGAAKEAGSGSPGGKVSIIWAIVITLTLITEQIKSKFSASDPPVKYFYFTL